MTQSDVTDLPARGDEAFVCDATNGLDAGRTSTAWLRASNLIIKIVYADLAGESTVPALHQGASRAARRLTPERTL